MRPEFQVWVVLAPGLCGGDQSPAGLEKGTGAESSQGLVLGLSRGPPMSLAIPPRLASSGLSLCPTSLHADLSQHLPHGVLSFLAYVEVF